MSSEDQSLVQVLQEITSNFNKHTVKYLIVGGTAVNFHGYPRLSLGLPEGIDFDIDIWYQPTISNFDNLTKAIKSLGFSRADELDKIIFDSNKTFLRLVHGNYKLELLTIIKGFDKSEFLDCYHRRVDFDLDGENVTIISYEDLLKNKKALLRPLDEKDISELENRKKNPGSNDQEISL